MRNYIISQIIGEYEYSDIIEVGISLAPTLARCPFVIVFLQYFVRDIHPIRDDLLWYTRVQMMGDGTPADRVRSYA